MKYIICIEECRIDQEIKAMNSFLSSLTAMLPKVNSTTLKPINETAPRAERLSDLEIRRANYIWPEDPADELPVK